MNYLRSTDFGEPDRKLKLHKTSRLKRWYFHFTAHGCPLILVHGPNFFISGWPPEIHRALSPGAIGPIKFGPEGIHLLPFATVHGLQFLRVCHRDSYLFALGKDKSLFLESFCPLHHVTYPHMGGVGRDFPNGALETTVHPQPLLALMNGLQLYDSISFVSVDTGFPHAAQRIADGPTEDVAQSRRRLQALSTAWWLPVYPMKLSRAGPSYMALTLGPFGHPAWVHIPAKMQPTPSAPPNPSAPHPLSEPSSAYRRCPSTYQFIEAWLPPTPLCRSNLPPP